MHNHDLLYPTSVLSPCCRSRSADLSIGAAAVGMHALLLDRAGRIPDDGSTIRRLADLLGLLPPRPPGEE